MQIRTIPFCRTIPAALISSLLCLSFAAKAQESANADLDACVKEEQIALTVKGAGAGALAGLGAALFSGNKNDALKKAAIGAAVGGAAGFATAYFTSVDTCYKKNPSWIPETRIERSKGYEQVKLETNYKPSEGIKAQATRVEMPITGKAGSTLNVVSSFIVLTPDGAETRVTLERKLFAIVDGKETAVPFLGKTSEERTVEPGENKDSVGLRIPPEAKPGTKYRFEFSVSAGGLPASVTETVTVE